MTTVEALAHTAVLHCPELLTDEKAETFVNKVADLIARYLKKS